VVRQTFCVVIASTPKQRAAWLSQVAATVDACFPVTAAEPVDIALAPEEFQSQFQ